MAVVVPWGNGQIRMTCFQCHLQPEFLQLSYQEPTQPIIMALCSVPGAWKADPDT